MPQKEILMSREALLCLEVVYVFNVASEPLKSKKHGVAVSQYQAKSVMIGLMASGKVTELMLVP